MTSNALKPSEKSSDGQSNFRTLIHEHTFEEECQSLERNPLLEAPIRGLMWGISEAAEEFSLVPGYDDLRIAKSEKVITKKGIIPRLLIHFRILDESTVSLLHIEVQPDPDVE